ncbi:unnamed protein product, partial [Brassica rapa subsp. trilocularis]
KSSIIGLYGILTDILSLASSFECVSFHWISLMKNAEADKLAKQVLSSELALMATTTLETDPNTGKKLVMELELGLKVTRTREDVSSSVDFRFSKDPFGPLVLSQETDSRFIIIIHLKGFKKEGIEIEINKEGDRITIRGRKPVEEMVMIRWMAWRNEVEMRAFRKNFLIPDVVDLDKIKARFDDDDATLTITMPKRVKGISGFNLEQAEEEFEEESVGFGDVSEVENREEVEEETEEREESDEHSEIQGEEGFGEMVEDKERESQVNEGEEEGFSGGVDETQIEDDDVEEIQQIGQQELADSDTESEDNVLKQLPDIKEQEDNQEVMEKKVLEEIKNEEIGSGATEEIEEQESDEDSGLKEIPDMIEQEDNQEVMEQKVLEDTKSGDIRSEAVEEIEQEPDGNSGSDTKSKDSGLEKLPDIIEQEDNEEVMEHKVSEETKSKDNGSGAVKEIQERESHEDSALKKLPEIIEQENNQEVMEQKVSEETKSEDNGSGAVKEIQEQESHEDSGLKELQDIIGQKDNRERREHKVSEGTKSDGIVFGAVKEIEEQESDEVGGTSKSRVMEKKKTDDDDGLRKAQGIDESLRRNEESKIQEMVEEETVGQEKDDNLEKSQQTDEEERVGQREFADSNTESGDSSSLRKLPDINQDVMEQKDSQAETKSDDFGSRASKEIEKQEPHEQLDGTSKSRATSDDDGSNKVQGTEEPERCNEESNIQEMVRGDPKEDVDAEMGEGFTPNIERTPVVAETEAKAGELESKKTVAENVEKKHDELVEKKEEKDRRSFIKLQENEEQHSSVTNDVPKPVQETEAPEMDTLAKTNDEEKEKKKSVEMEKKNIGEGFAPNIAETEKKPEDFESEKQGAGDVDKIHKLEEKKKEEDANVRAKGEDRRSLVKLQENKEEHSKGRKRQNKQENIKGLLEEKAPEADTKIVNDIQKPVKEIEVPEVGTLGETGDEGKEKKNIVETETKPEDFESDKLEAEEVDKIDEVVEQKKEEEDAKNDEAGPQSSSIEPQGVGEQLSQGQKRHEKTKELVEEKTPEAEKAIENDTPKRVQEETNDTDSRKPQENIRQQELDEREKESKTQELVKINTNDEEKGTEETITKEQDSYWPNVLGEEKEVQELAEEKPHFSKNRKLKEEEKVPENGDDDDISRKAGDSEEKEEVDSEMGKGFAPNIAETVKKPEDFDFEKLGADEVEKIQKLVENKEEEDDNVRAKDEDRRSLIKMQEDEEPHSKARKRQDIQENIKQLVEEKAPEAETDISNDTLKPVQEINEEVSTLGEAGDEIKEGKEKKKSESESLEVTNRDAKKETDVKMGVPNIAETETKPEEFESDQLKADKIHEPVEKKKEEEKSEGIISLIKTDEVEEQQSQGQKQEGEHEMIEELVEEKTPEAETNISNDTLKPVEERGEGKQKIPKLFQEEETKKQPEEHKEKRVETRGKIDDAVSREVEEIIRQQDLDRCEKESKTQEVVKSKTNDEEKGAGETEIKEQESYGPKILWDEEIAEKKTEFDDHQSSRRDSDSKEEVDVEIGKRFKQNIAETETKAEEFESHKPEPDEVNENDDIHEVAEKKEEDNDKVRRQDEDEDRSLLKLQENEKQHSKRQNRQETNIPTPVQETGNEGKEKKKSVTMEIKNGYPKEEVDAEMGKGFTPNAAETETKPEEFESDEVDEVVAKKEEEDNAKMRRRQIEGSNLNKKFQETKEQQQQEKIKELVEEKTPAAAETTVATQIPKPTQEIEEPEVGTCEEETKDQELYRPKVFGDDDDHHISRKVGDAGQRDSGAKEEVDPEMSTPNISETETKEVEEDDMIHELVENKKKKKVRRQSEDSRLQEEKIKELLEEAETEKPKVEERLETCEENIFSEAETKDQESYRPKILQCEDKIQELAEEKMDFSRKVEEEEETAEKKTEQDIDAMKRKEETQEQVMEEKVSDSGNKTVAEAMHEEDEPGNQFQELIEGEKTSCQGEVKGVESEKNTREVDKRFREAQEVERTDSDDVSGIYGKGELQEEDDRLQRGTSKIEQELVNLNSQMEQELEDENINSSCKDEESEIKTDDVIRKVQGVKEHELCEPKRNHGSKIKEMIQEKIGEVEKEDEVQESHEPNIRKERRCKTKITGTEEPSGQAREEEEKEKFVESRTITEIKDQRPDKPESHEKRYKIQKMVEAGHNEEQKDAVKAKQTSKVVQEIEQQESDELSSSVVQEDKKQETAEKRTKTEDASLRKVQDDEDPEMSKSYKKIQEPVKMGTSDYKEEVKKQDGDDTLRIQEPPDKPNLDELERHSEQGDKIHEPVEMRTHDDYREKFKKQDGDVDEEKVEDDSSDKFHEFEEQKSHEHERQEKRKHFSKEEATDPKESEEHEKPKVVEEKETLERKKTRSRDVQDDAEPEFLKPYKPQEEDKKKVHKLVEKGTSDYREKVKKQDGNDTLISKKQRSTPQYVDEEKLESIADPGEKMEDDNSRKFHEPKSDDDWPQLEREKMKDLVKEEATGPKDKCTAEAGHSDHKEEQHEDTAKTELKAEEDTSEKVQEIEKHKSDELQRSLGQDKMQEIEEKEKTKAMEENETVERRKITEVGDKTQELVEMDTNDYREKGKTQDGDDILRSQETEKLFIVEEEATGPRDKHTGGKEEERDEEVAQTETKVEDETNKEVEENQKEEEEEDEGSLDDPMINIQEIEKEDSHDTEIQEKLDIVQEDFVEEETVDQEDEVAMEAVEANYDEDSSRILQTIKEHEEHKEKRNGPGVEGEDEERIVEKEAYEEALDLKHTGGERYNDHKEEEKFIPKAEVKAEENSSEEEFDELQRSLVQDKMQETEEKGKPRSTEENETVEGRTKTEDDGSLRKVQEGEDPELSKHKRHEEELKKEDEERKIHQSVEDVKGEDKTLDQEDDRVGEAEAVVANNEKDSSRKLHTTTGGEELKQQEEIPDPRVKEGDGERVAEKETKMEKVHVQEPEVKTENGESRRGQKGKQEKNDETRSDDGIVRKVGETKVQESDEKKDQEPEEKIEEPERKEMSNDGVKLVTEEDSLTKGQEFIEKESSKRRPVGQENIQQLKDAEKQEDEGKSDAGVEMQAKIVIRRKDQETKRQKAYELLENEEHDKIPEPVVEGTKNQRVEDREAEEMKRKSEDVSSRKVQKIKEEETDGLEKHRELSGFQENESVDEEEVNEAGGYKEVLETKSMEDSSQTQDVEEKGPDHTEQENIQEIMAEEEEEKNEKEKRMPHVDSKANYDSSEKNETERLRGKKQKEDHQEVVETETSDQMKEEREEKIVGKAVTRDECDSSRKNQDHEEIQSDKIEEMSGLLGKEETSNDKEENRGNRAGAKTTIKDDKKQLLVEIDTSGKAKENTNQETKSRDDSSRENEKQDSHEQKRNYEEQDKKNMGPNYYRSEEDGKEEKETAEAEGTRKKKGIEERESAKMVERHENITDLVEEKMNNQEGEDKKSMSMEVLEKSEDHESTEPEGLRKQDKDREQVQQRSTDNLKYEETTETVKDKESRKTHQLKEERLKEKENRETECEDGSSKRIQEIDKDGSTEPRRVEERDKIQPVDRETSEDEEEEELEVEVEDSEEDWEAEVIQEMDSDEDNDKLRKIRRIKLGFSETVQLPSAYNFKHI